MNFHDALITWLFEVKWQIKYMISSLAEDLGYQISNALLP